MNKVWDALTKPEHLNLWYTKNADIEFCIGGKGYMNHGWGATSEGVFTEIDIIETLCTSEHRWGFYNLYDFRRNLGWCKSEYRISGFLY